MVQFTFRPSCSWPDSHPSSGRGPKNVEPLSYHDWNIIEKDTNKVQLTTAWSEAVLDPADLSKFNSPLLHDRIAFARNIHTVTMDTNLCNLLSSNSPLKKFYVWSLLGFQTLQNFWTSHMLATPGHWCMNIHLKSLYGFFASRSHRSLKLCLCLCSARLANPVEKWPNVACFNPL